MNCSRRTASSGSSTASSSSHSTRSPRRRARACANVSAATAATGGAAEAGLLLEPLRVARAERAVHARQRERRREIDLLRRAHAHAASAARPCAASRAAGCPPCSAPRRGRAPARPAARRRGRPPSAARRATASSGSSSTTSQTSSNRPSTSFSVRISRANAGSPPRFADRCRSGRCCPPSDGGSRRRVGLGFAATSAAADTTWPGVQKPHCTASARTNASIRGWSRSPSIVVISPETLCASVMHESVGTPSICTVHAPQCPSLHAIFVPVSPTTSRSSLREAHPDRRVDVVRDAR